MSADTPGAAPLPSTTLSRLFDQPELDTPGVQWARPANHVQHRVARSGLLYRTEDRLGFQPKGIDALLGARAVSWELSSITDVQLKPTLRRLRVTVTTDTGRQRFLTAQALVVYNDLRSWQRRQDGADPDGTAPAEGGGAPA